MQKSRDATTRRAATASWSRPRWRARYTGCETTRLTISDGSGSVMSIWSTTRLGLLVLVPREHRSQHLLRRRRHDVLVLPGDQPRLSEESRSRVSVMGRTHSTPGRYDAEHRRPQHLAARK